MQKNYIERFKLEFACVIILAIMLLAASYHPNNGHKKRKVTANKMFPEGVIKIPGHGTFIKMNGVLMQYPTYGGNR